jgi:hypothetical protein
MSEAEETNDRLKQIQVAEANQNIMIYQEIADVVQVWADYCFKKYCDNLDEATDAVLDVVGVLATAFERRGVKFLAPLEQLAKDQANLDAGAK